MRQFLWYYVRAWWWTHVPEGPRFGRALWGWLGLGVVCSLSLRFGAEIWPHTPTAGTWAVVGLALAGVGSLALVLRGLWRWAGLLLRHSYGLSKAMLVLLLLAGAGLALFGLAWAVLIGLGAYLISTLGWAG